MNARTTKSPAAQEVDQIGGCPIDWCGHMEADDEPGASPDMLIFRTAGRVEYMIPTLVALNSGWLDLPATDADSHAWACAYAAAVAAGQKPPLRSAWPRRPREDRQPRP